MTYSERKQNNALSTVELYSDGRNERVRSKTLNDTKPWIRRCVSHRRQSVYDIVRSTVMARPQGPKSEARRTKLGVMFICARDVPFRTS